MSDLPARVFIREEGPREGFQYEKGPISTADKIRLIDMIARSGVSVIETVSFVSPKWVPQMADAEQVVTGIRKVPGVEYIAAWLNQKGLERAAALREVLTLHPVFPISASEAFSVRNMNRTNQQSLDELPAWAALYRSLGFAALDVGVTAAFGCNYQGDIPVDLLLSVLRDAGTRAREAGMGVGALILADTMGWANPLQIKRVVSAVREQWPRTPLHLHLHDTRGMGLANFVAGLEMGVTQFDAAVAGLGGCPFAAIKGSAGNICTEDAVSLCHEMGIETGIDLDQIIAAAQLAEEIVGHPLPGKVKSGGNLAAYRRQAKG